MSSPIPKSSRSSGYRLLLPVVAHLPLVGLFLIDLWRQRPHYEFVPFVLVFAAWLIRIRRPAATVHTKRSKRLGYLLLSSCVVLLPPAVVFFSPWLAAVSAILTIGGALLLHYGSGAFRNLTGPWLLLWLAVPPPLGLDSRLIQLLQQTTSGLVSGILEYGGVLHNLDGNVFQLPNRELFVAEACSGVHSQFVLLAACFIFAVYVRASARRVFWLAAAACFWSVAANALRVTTVVVAAARFDTDLASGISHDILGYALIASAFAMLALTDRFLLAAFAPIWDTEAEMGISEETRFVPAADFWSRFWNRWIAVTAARPTGADPPDAAEQPEPETNRIPGWIQTGFAGVSGVMLILASLQLALISRSGERSIDMELYKSSIAEDWFSQDLPGWRFAEYRTVDRDIGSDEGQRSSDWQYQSDFHFMHVSVDYPFFGWHQLQHCYEARGWQVAKQTIRTADEAAGGGSFVEVELTRPSGAEAFLQFGLFRQSGELVTPRQTAATARDRSRLLTEKIMANPLVAWWQGSSRASGDPAAIQFQQFVAADYRLKEEEKERFRELFSYLRGTAQRRLKGVGSGNGQANVTTAGVPTEIRQ